MPIMRFIFIPMLILIAFISVLSLQSVSACPNYANFSKAYENSDIPALRKLAKNLDDCTEISGDKYRYFIATKLYSNLARNIAEGAAVTQDYDEILAINPHFWAALADLGDISMKGKNYKAGLSFYEHAIVDIKGPEKGEIVDIKRDKDKISNDYILTLKDKADNARLLVGLSGQFIPPKARGMYSFAIRGVEVNLHKYPIKFDYNQHILRQDKANTQHLALLFDILHAENDPDIEVIGHTDDIGSDAYNDKLSLRRANTIRDYLLKKKYKGTIKAIGKGKRVKIEMHSAQRKDLTDEQWQQLNRRVETKRVFDHD